MKTNNPKQQYAKERLALKNFICTSNTMVKWCKNYLSRSDRRKARQDMKKEMEKYEYKSNVVD